MNAAALLGTLRASGAVLAVEDGTLAIDSPAPLPDALLAALRQHKAAILNLLTAGTGPEAIPATPAANNDPVSSPDLDYLEHLLRDERLCLILRDGRLIYTGPDGRGAGQPSGGLAAYVNLHRAALIALFSVPDTGTGN